MSEENKKKLLDKTIELAAEAMKSGIKLLALLNAGGIASYLAFIKELASKGDKISFGPIIFFLIGIAFNGIHIAIIYINFSYLSIERTNKIRMIIIEVFCWICIVASIIFFIIGVVKSFCVLENLNSRL